MTRRPGKGWLRSLARRVEALGGPMREDAPPTFPQFDAMMTDAFGAPQRKGNERQQGPNEYLGRAVGAELLSKWYGDHHLSVDHDRADPRTVRLVRLLGMGNTRHSHVWIHSAVHAAWVAGWSSLGWGEESVEFECRHLDVDEILVLTEAIHSHAFGSSASWHFRCTPRQIADIAARARGIPRASPYIGYHDPSEALPDVMRRKLGSDLIARTARIVSLFDRIGPRAS